MERFIYQGAWLPGQTAPITDPAVLAKKATPEQLAHLTREGAIEGFDDLLGGRKAGKSTQRKGKEQEHRARAAAAVSREKPRDELPRRPVSHTRPVDAEPRPHGKGGRFVKRQPVEEVEEEE